MSDFPPVLPPCPKECLVLYNKEQEQWTSTVSNNRHLQFVSLFSFFSSFLRKKYIIMLFTEQNNFYNVNMMPRKKERKKKKKSVFWCFFWSGFHYSGHIWQKVGIVFKLSKNGKEYSKEKTLLLFASMSFLLSKESRKSFFMNCFFNENLYLRKF